MRVEGALAFNNVLRTEFEQSLSGEEGPAEAKPTTGGDQGWGAKYDPPSGTADLFGPVGAMAGCDKACAGGETMFSLAKRGLPRAPCGPPVEPSGVLPVSTGAGEKRRGGPLASRELGHPALEGCSPLCGRTRAGNELLPLKQRGPVSPCQSGPRD